MPPSRRDFLHASSAAAVASLAPGEAPARPQAQPRSRPPARPDQPRRRLAVVTTAYYYLSHAYHVCGRFLHGYLRSGRMHYPDYAIAGMHVEQTRPGDLSAELSRTHRFPLFKDVAGALTLGGDRLAVDGVLLIAEHGDYPKSETDSIQYPKRRLFGEIVQVFEKTGRVVPVFSDKHLEDDWPDIAWFYGAAQRLRI